MPSHTRLTCIAIALDSIESHRMSLCRSGGQPRLTADLRRLYTVESTVPVLYDCRFMLYSINCTTSMRLRLHEATVVVNYSNDVLSTFVGLDC